MNMNGDLLSKFFIFITGAAIGSVVTWKILETKFEQKVQEEIELTKEYYSQKDPNPVENEKLDELEDAPDEYYEGCEKKEYEGMVEKLNYTNYSNTSKKENKKEEDEVEKPYVIPPDEIGDLDDYEYEELTYYTDGIVADDFGNIVDDIDNTIGADFADHYGEYEEDTVYIRNDAKMTEYAVMRDYRKYSEVYRTED